VKAPARPDLTADANQGSQRIDQWLWFARIVKSRTLAQALIMRGKVRINRIKIDKSSVTVRPSDVLTLSLGPRVMSIEILGIGLRRGPAPEAQMLYRDLTPKPPKPTPAGQPSGVEEAAGEITVQQALRPDGSGRPTKRQRRQIEKFMGRK
jgi:ribosome-associated heat shock protein Hsp15